MVYQVEEIGFHQTLRRVRRVTKLFDNQREISSLNTPQNIQILIKNLISKIQGPVRSKKRIQNII